MKKLKHLIHLRSIVINLLFFSVITGFAQPPDNGVVVDKIVSKVDDYIILKSDVERAYLD